MEKLIWRFRVFTFFFWNIKVLSAVQVMAWRVLKNKIVTKVNLAQCGMVVESIICCFCGLEEEFINHLFFFTVELLG